MKALLGLQLAVMALLLSACVTAQPPPPADPAFAALNIHSMAIGPVAYATYQPSEQCTTFIDEDLRVALKRELRRRGYEVLVAGSSVPRSFSVGLPLPQAGGLPSAELLPATDADGLLSVWIEEYWEHCPCGCERDGSYLTMGAVAVLYAGSPPVEVWRSRARTAEQGSYSAHDLIWLTTTRLADQLLGTIPAGPGWRGQR